MDKILVIIFGLLLIGCKKDKPDENNWQPYNPTSVEIINPFSNFPDMEIPEWNKTSEEGIRLGRKLYYDNILSTNGKSCSTCHPQNLSFTNPISSPNEMDILPHINLGWNSEFGWNGGTKWLDSVALADLEEGNIFLNANNDSIKARFERHPVYQEMFWDAFGVLIIELSEPERQKYISYALAQFMRTMIAGNSRFDRYLLGENVLTPEEIEGFNLFMREDKGDCFHCHGDSYNPLWKDNLFHNNGLNSAHIGVDQGRFLVTGDPTDMGKFKTPTLRNVELTGPYMHDGRFSTLEEVVNFYSTGLQNSPTIDPLMKNVTSGGAMLNPTEIGYIVAFLKSLTDYSFTTNSNLSAP